MKRRILSGEENLLKVNVEAFEKHIILSALARTRGNQRLAAKQLGTTTRVIAYRIRKYGIGLEQFCDGSRKKPGETAAAASFHPRAAHPDAHGEAPAAPGREFKQNNKEG